MHVSNNYVCLTKLEEPKQGDFKTVEVTDSSVFKGRVHALPEAPLFMGNRPIAIGDVVVFAKYSPDTHEVELDGLKFKFVAVRDLMAII